MNRNEPSSRARVFFSSKVFLICAFLLTLVFAIGFARAYFKDYAFREEVKRLQGEISQLEKKKLESIELLKYVSSTSYIEDTARLDFNLKKPGEQVLFIEKLGKEDESEDRGRKIVGSGQEMTNPLKWWYYFIHRTPETGR